MMFEDENKNLIFNEWLLEFYDFDIKKFFNLKNMNLRKEIIENYEKWIKIQYRKRS